MTALVKAWPGVAASDNLILDPKFGARETVIEEKSGSSSTFEEWALPTDSSFKYLESGGPVLPGHACAVSERSSISFACFMAVGIGSQGMMLRRRHR